MKCVVICSGKGGTGKSCVAAYTAQGLARAGKKTLLVDLGADYRALDLILGIQTAAFGALDYLAGRCELEEAVLPADEVGNLFFMPAGDGEESSPSSDAVFQLLGQLHASYDYILVDGVDWKRFPVKAANLVLMVATPDVLSVRAASEVAGFFYAAGASELALVINNVPARVVPMEGLEDFDRIIDRVGARLMGVIPASPMLQHCANNGLPLSEESLTLRVFDNLAARVSGGRRPLLIR